LLPAFMRACAGLRAAREQRDGIAPGVAARRINARTQVLTAAATHAWRPHALMSSRLSAEAELTEIPLHFYILELAAGMGRGWRNPRPAMICGAGASRAEGGLRLPRCAVGAS
jgi:hypothetical protein